MQTFPSKISQVTVFRQGALVTRCAELEEPQGGWPQQLALGGLPLALLDQSVQIRLEFPAGGDGLLATDLRVELEWQAAPKVQSGLPNLKPLQEQLARTNLAVEQLSQDISRLEALSPGPRPTPQPGQPPLLLQVENRRAVVALRQKLLAEMMQEREQRIQEAERLIREIADQQKAVASGPPPKDFLTKSVVLSLYQTSQADPPPAKVRALLSYQVEGARWAPSYTLRFDRDFTMAELAMRALVCQSSGENWQDVRLEVSTADFTTWKDLPELPSRRLGRRQAPTRRSGWRPPPLNTESLFGDFDRGPGVLTGEEEPFGNRGFPQPESSDPFAALGAPPPDPFGGQSDPFAAQSDPFAAQSDPFAAPGPAAACYNKPMLGGAAPDSEAGTRAGMLRRSAPSMERELKRKGGDEGGKPLLRPSPAMSPKVSSFAAPSMPVRPGGPPPAKPQARPPAPEVQWDLSTDQMAYSLLYLPGPREWGRGKLRQQTPLDACMRLWQQRYPDAEGGQQVRRLLEEALREARRALYVGAPTAHRFPGPLSQHDYLFAGESPVELAGDGEFHSLPILTRQLPAQLVWMVVPRITREVFRRASLECLPDLALPAGPVDIFVAQDYLATTDLGDITPGQTFDIGLGVEQSVKVIRNTTFKEQTAGMMGGTLQLRHEIRVEASNQLQREIRLTIQEALPEPEEQSEAKVKVESCEPAWTPLKSEPGYQWSLRVPAGEVRSATVQYTIEMPSKLELVGGNRREN